MKRARRWHHLRARRGWGLGPFECALAALIGLGVAVTLVTAIVNP
jgi:hypothetical protein